MMNKIIFLILVSALSLSGCNSLGHMNELVTLNSIGTEQKLMDKDVKKQNKNFEKLLLAIQRNDFTRLYPTNEAVVKAFGSPVFSRFETINHQPVEFMLYRKATEYFDSDKVYLYFDSTGLLLNQKLVKSKPIQ